MNTQNFKLIGLQVRHLREAKKISQEQLANQAGLSTGTIGKIERGLINPKTETLIRIARELEIPCHLLFAKYDKGSSLLSPQLHRLVQYARCLNEEEMELLCFMAKSLQRYSRNPASTHF